MEGKPQTSYFPKAGVNHGGSHPFLLGVGSLTLTLTLGSVSEGRGRLVLEWKGLTCSDKLSWAESGLVVGPPSLSPLPPPRSRATSCSRTELAEGEGEGEPLASKELWPPPPCCRPPPLQVARPCVPLASRAVPPPTSLPGPPGPGATLPPCLSMRLADTGGCVARRPRSLLRAIVRLAAKGL